MGSPLFQPFFLHSSNNACQVQRPRAHTADVAHLAVGAVKPLTEVEIPLTLSDVAAHEPIRAI
jgi:hypothetical protein